MDKKLLVSTIKNILLNIGMEILEKTLRKYVKEAINYLREKIGFLLDKSFELIVSTVVGRVVYENRFA